MKLLLRLFAIVGLSFAATAAEEEKLPDWMNLKIQVDVRTTKPQTADDYLALMKAAVKQKTDVPLELEIPKEFLAKPVKLQVNFLEASKEMSVRDYLEMALKGAEVRRPVWEKSGENGVKFIPVYLRTFGLTHEVKLKIDRTGKVSAERLTELLVQRGTPLSKHSRLVVAGERGTDKVVLDAVPADIRAMEQLLKAMGWRE